VRAEIAVQLAEQGISVFLCAVGDMCHEALNLLSLSIAESRGSTKVDGVCLHKNRIELMLSDYLAETIANACGISLDTISVFRMWR
jgi:hypothetical protein